MFDYFSFDESIAQTWQDRIVELGRRLAWWNRWSGWRRVGAKALSLLLIVVLIGFPLFSIINPSAAKAAWWNDGWSYRKSIAITAHTSLESNVYINLASTNALDTSDTSRFQGDCGDLRFTDAGGNVLDYYVVSGCGTATTVIHVNFLSFAAGAQTIFYYYGNPSAADGFSNADFGTEAASYTIGSQGGEERSEGPLAYWSLNDGYGTTVQDGTNNNYDGTISGASWQTEEMCVSGKCLAFDGTNDVVTAGDVEATSALTISGWIKKNSSSLGGIVSKRQSSEVNGNWMLSSEADGTLGWSVWSATDTVQTTNSTATLARDRWYHVAVTFDESTDTTKFYINGKLNRTTTTVTNNLVNNAQVVKIGESGANDFFKGTLDEIKYYDFVLTDAQIQSAFISKGSVLAGTAAGQIDQKQFSDGLVGYWRMNETAANSCSGGTNDTCDSSGNSLDAAWNNGTVAARSAAKFGAGVAFDGTSGTYASIANSSLMGITNDITIATWIKRGATGDYGGILGKTNSSTLWDYDLYICDTSCAGGAAANNKLSFFSNGGSIVVDYISPGAITDTNWHHVAASRIGSTLTLYIDGAPVGSTTVSDPFPNNTFPMYIGTDDNNGGSANNLNGDLDDVRLYNRGLSNSEIGQLYDFAPGPSVYIPFEEMTGTSAFDISGNGNNGTLTNGPTWATGKIGNAVKMKGSAADAYVNITDSAANSPAQISVSGWVYLTSYNTGFPALIQKTGSYSLQVYSSSGGTPGRIEWDVRTPSEMDTVTDASDALQLNRWYFLAATYNPGTGISQVYIDGVLKKQSTGLSGTLFDSSQSTTIGAGNASGNYLDGTVDEVKIYNYARSTRQIIDDMNGGSPIGASSSRSMIGHWKFDDGQGTTARNSGILTSTLDGTLTNMASPATSISGWNNGNYGKALAFDAADDKVDAGSNSTIDDMPTLTYSAWIKPNTVGEAGTTGRIFDKSTIGFFLANTNAIEFTITYSTQSLLVLSSNNSISMGAWQHVIATWDGTTNATGVHIYVNGREVTYQTQTDASGTRSTDAAANLTIGNRAGATDRTFDGLIDEAKLYNYPLSISQIKNDFNTNKTSAYGVLGTNADGTPSNSTDRGYCPPGDTTATCGPTGEWSFEEGSGTSVKDSSGNNYTGTWSGTGSHWGRGKIGKAGVFNGSDDYVSTSNQLNFTQAQSFSVAAWIKTSGNPSEVKSIVDKGFGYNNTYGLYLDNNTSNGAVFYIHDSARINAVSGSTSALTDNAWHYLVGVRDTAADKFYIYVDGALKGTTNDTTTGDFNRASNIRMGANGVDATGKFNGSIDQAQIFNYALSPAQVAWDYNRGKPVAQYKFDECQGSSLKDSSGNNLHGTISAGAGGITSIGTCDTGSSMWGNGASGKFNSSLDFDGADDNVSMGDQSKLEFPSATSFTLSTWVKSSLSSTGTILAKKNATTATNSGYLLKLASTGVLSFYAADGTDQFQLDSSNAVTANTWTHVVVVYDRSSASATDIYVNGKKIQATQTGTLGNVDDIGVNSASLKIGSESDDQDYFDGQIDAAQIFNYPLTSYQIRLLYNQGSAVRFGP